MRGEDRRDGMYGVMSTQTFRHKARHRPNDGFKVFSKLVLNDDMKESVGLYIWQLGSRQTVMLWRSGTRSRR